MWMVLHDLDLHCDAWKNIVYHNKSFSVKLWQLLMLSISPMFSTYACSNKCFAPIQVAGKRIKELDLKKCNIGAELEAKIEQLLLARSFDEEDLFLNPPTPKAEPAK